ncbi:hypothetical protein ACFL3V_03140 [Nanoarchaeota archaeon]
MKAKTPDRILNMVFIMTVMLAMLVLISSSVSALGVGPSRQFISFSSGQIIEGELMIINDGKEDFRAAVYAQGDLADYIKLGKPIVDVSASDMVKTVPYTIEFPTASPKPGQHKLEVVVRQFPPDSDVADDTMVSANLAVISQIIVKVPYAGKYAEAKLFISGTENDDTPARFTVMLYNHGTEDIERTYAKVEVLSPTFEKVAEIYTNNRSVKPKEEVKLETLWKPSVSKGSYKAVVTVRYDDKEFKLEQAFDLGRFLIDVSDISVNKFSLGDVAKFDILLFNSWNTKIDDVYVEMIVEDSSGKKMTEFKTSVIDIPSQQGGELEAYWYTEGAAPGIYTVKLIVHYAGKITQKEYDFEVSTNSMTKLGTVGQAIISEEEKQEVKTQGLLIVLIIFVIVMLIVMNIVWFYFLSRQIRKKGGEK